MDPHLIHGDPPVRNESRAPSSSRALETRQQRPARGPASSACDSLLALVLVLLRLQCGWYQIHTTCSVFGWRDWYP